MTDDTRDHAANDGGDLSRRDFVARSIAAGLVVAAGSTAGAQGNPMEMPVTIKTPDGECDAYLIHPSGGGPHPGVIIWPDAFGLRQSMRDMGKRLAAEGYVVLVPNPFYRVGKAPLPPPGLNFSNPDDRKKIGELMGTIGAPGAAEKDAAAFVAFLDSQSMVDKKRKIGTQGYCMGGPLVFRTMASQAERVGAGGSFHGGGLVTDQPTSPHLLIPKMKGRLYVGVAANDDERQPAAKDTLRTAFAEAKVPAEVEVYPGALHGWCVPDMPAEAGKPIYDKPAAEKAWAKLLGLYKTALT